MATSVLFQMVIRGKLREYERGVAVANTSAIRRVTNRLKTQGRRQIERAGLGKRLANSLRGEVYASTGADITKRGVDVSPTGRVRSNALVKGRKGGTVDLLSVFEHGVTIQGSPMLAIGTAAAGGRKAKPPGSFPPGTFRYVPLKRGKGRPRKNAAVAVLVHKARKEVWYTLLPSVALKKRLTLETLYRRALASVPGELEKSYARLFKRLEVAA